MHLRDIAIAIAIAPGAHRTWGLVVDGLTQMEGMHFMLPWFEMPIIYDIRPKPRMIQSLTGSKGPSVRPPSTCFRGPDDDQST